MFAVLSPSVAFIETPVGGGSGLLIDGGYVVTNAHVVWPFERARVVFPDRTEFLEVPVVATDLMGDIAVLGPIKTAIRPLALKNGEGLPVGTEIYLIGYPGEQERYPQPTFGRGLLSRVRQWKSEGVIDMTYFQTDASIASGQSGGALVSSDGSVIGITGYSFTEAGFALSASAADVSARIRCQRGRPRCRRPRRSPLRSRHSIRRSPSGRCEDNVPGTPGRQVLHRGDGLVGVSSGRGIHPQRYEGNPVA